MLKILTLNIWNYEGPWQQRLSLIRHWLRLLNPDLIGIQEVLSGDAIDQTSQLFDGLEYHRAYDGPMAYWNDPSLSFGNLIASRWPIEDLEIVPLPMGGHGDQRVLLSSIIDSPHGKICFNTTHLSARPEFGHIRETQVTRIAEVLARRRQLSELPPILCGDLNATPDATEIRFLKGQHSLEGNSIFLNDAWATLHPQQPGYTFSRKNGYLRDKLFYDSRLDYILVGSPIRGRGTVRHCELACHLPQDDLFPSDHFGLYAELEL